MSKSKFVYATYIRTTPEKLWEALLSPEFTKVYWFGVTLDCAWTKGAPWKMLYPDGRVTDSGEIIDIVPQKRIVIRWRNEFRPELKAEGFSRCTMEIEAMKGLVKLTILHEIERPESKLIDAVSGGWPKILSNLKSLLETGSALPDFAAQVK